MSNKIIYSLFVVVVLSLASCSNDDYANALPADSMAVASISLSQGDNDNENQAKVLLQTLLGMDVSDDLGLDFTQKVYLFETNDGLFGCCVKVDDKDKLLNSLNVMVAGNGKDATAHEYKGYHFAVVKENWMAGLSDDALLVVGPVIKAQFTALKQRMTKWLKADDNESLVSKPMFQHLDSIDAPMAFVAQIQALPDQVRFPLTMGVPKDQDGSQVFWAATMKPNGNIVDLEGELFSFNKQLDDSIKASNTSFRTITGLFSESLSKDDMASFVVNIEGDRLLDFLRADKNSQMLLAGVNAAIDLDNILRCVDGEVLLTLHSFKGQQMEMDLLVQLKSQVFLKNVGYWKASCPKGTSITDVGPNAFRFTDGNVNFYFGIDGNNWFYVSTSPKNAEKKDDIVEHPLDDAVKDKMKGKNLCLLVNLQSLVDHPDIGSFFSPVKTALFGKVNTLIYHSKKN